MLHKISEWLNVKPARAPSSAEKRHHLVGPPKLWKMKREFQIQFLKNAGLKPECYLLDLGCGTLRGGIPIISYLENGHYFGIEVREEVLEEGRKELHESRLEYRQPVLISTQDIGSLCLGREFDFIWAFSVLQHMTDEILESSFAMIQRHLGPKGRFYANAHFGEKEDDHWQGFPVVWRSFESFQDLGSRYGLNVSDMGTLKSLGHVSGSEEQDIEQRMLEFRKA